MEIEKIHPVSFEAVHRILSSKKISNEHKIKFIRSNHTKIKKVSEFQVTSYEFNEIMKNRPLKKFKFLKNSFTKCGDKIILAKSLGIKPSEVASYIKNVSEDINDVNGLTFLPPDKLEQIKTYVYRHGSKDELVNFLDYELTRSKDIVSSLYTTLEYHTGGVADYFIRPIHRLDNNTLVKIFNVVDKNLEKAYEAGNIDQIDKDKISKDALISIYKIQNNNKLINAIKTAKVLNG